MKILSSFKDSTALVKTIRRCRGVRLKGFFQRLHPHQLHKKVFAICLKAERDTSKNQIASHCVLRCSFFPILSSGVLSLCRFFSVLTSGVLSLLFELGSARFNDILSVLFGLHGSESSSLVVLSTWRDFKILPSYFGGFSFAENILVYGIGKVCVKVQLCE